MSLNAPISGGAELLTRTTLRIGGDPASSVAALIAALHRVPGVLYAEVDSASSRATIAHDAAVPRAALLAAAAAAGVFAVALSPTPNTNVNIDIATPALPSVRMRNLAAVATGIYVALALIYMMRSNVSENPWMFSIFLVPVWAFFIAQAIGRRRR